MSGKTYMFLVAEIGLAHLAESLAVAEELSARKNRVIFALPKRKWGLIKNYITKVEFVEINPLLDRDSIKIVELIKDKDYVNQKVREDLEIITRFKPDCVVIDYRPSAVAVCGVLEIPATYLTISAGLPGSCYIANPNLPKVAFMVVSPLLKRLANFLIGQMIGRAAEATKSIGKYVTADELTYRMKYIVPEFEGYLPRNNKRINVDYVGTIFWKGFESQRPVWLDKIKPNGKTIYLTFGGTGFDGEKLVKIAESLLERGYRVLVSSSSIAKISDFPRHPNLFVDKFLPGLEVCRKVDLVLCHGGHGTVMQAVWAGKPVICMPFNPDQMLHALRAQELGYGVCMWKLTPTEILKLMKFNWDDYDQMGRAVSEDAVVTAVEQVLSDYKKYQLAAQKCQQRMALLDGAKRAANSIEKFAKILNRRIN